MSAINCILVHIVPRLCPRTVGIGWVASSGFWMLVKFNEQLKENCLLTLNIINMLHGANCSWDHCGRLSHQITFSRVDRITCSDLMLMSWFFCGPHWKCTNFQTVEHLDSPHPPQLCKKIQTNFLCLYEFAHWRVWRKINHHDCSIAFGA